MKSESCKICGNVHNNHVHAVREMMLGIGDFHDYLECGNCGCIQIMNIPADMDKYYGAHYYSHQMRAPKSESGLANWLRKKWIGGSYCSGGILGDGLRFLLGHKKTSYGYFMQKLNLTFESRILDVGSGAGEFVLRLLRDGFRNVSGVDYYVKDDIYQGNRLLVKKAQIYDLVGIFDLIVFNNSLEHMDEQAKVVGKAHELLSPDGYLVIIIPLCDSHACRKYGKHWVQWDAPRHFYLHTQKSINLLCYTCRLRLVDVIYNSSHFQFEGSELYLRGYTLQDAPNPKQLINKRKQFQKAAAYLNQINDGDSAVFIFKKTDTTKV